MSLFTPWAKIAFVKWSYRQPPKFGYCPIVEASKLKAVPERIMNQAEGCLNMIHVDMAPVFTGLTAFAKAQLLGNLDCGVASAILSTPRHSDPSVYENAIRIEVVNVLLRLRQLVPGVTFPNLPSPLRQEDLAPKPIVPPSVEATTQLLPKVIRYDALGAPMDAQDEITVQEGLVLEEEIDWCVWGKIKETQANRNRQLAKSGVLSCLINLFHLTFDHECPVRMMRKKGSISIVAAKDFPSGTIRLTAVVTAPTYIQDKSDHPHAVEVKHLKTGVSGHTVTEVFYVNPEFSIPKASAVADGSLDWSHKSSPILFWGIKRSHDDDLWNCELETVNVSLVLAAGFNASGRFLDTEPVSDSASVEVPTMTNTRPIKKGEEVVLRVGKPTEKQKISRPKTWMTQVMADRKKKPTGEDSEQLQKKSKTG